MSEEIDKGILTETGSSPIVIPDGDEDVEND